MGSNSFRDYISPRNVAFFVVLLTLTVGAVFLAFGKYSDLPTRELFTRSAEDETRRVEYHAMVAEKIYADNIEDNLK